MKDDLFQVTTLTVYMYEESIQNMIGNAHQFL